MVLSPNIFVLLYVTSFILVASQATSISFSHKATQCISEEIVFVCIGLDSITSLSYTSSHRIHASIALTYIDPNILSDTTQVIYSQTTTSTTAHNIDAIICVPTLHTNISSIKDYSVIFRNRDDSNKVIASLIIPDFTFNDNSFDISSIVLNQSPLEITVDATSYFHSSLILSSVDVSLSLWITNQHCVQIKHGDIFAQDEYLLSVQLYSSSNKLNAVMLATQATLGEYGRVSWNNAYICLSNAHAPNTMMGDFMLYSTTELSGIYSNRIEYLTMNVYNICHNSNGSETILNFAIGDVSIVYLAASCASSVSYECDVSSNRMANKDTQSFITEGGLNFGIFLFVCILSLVGFVVILIANYGTKKWWVSADPVKYDYIMFCIVSLWSSVSQILFVFYLFHSLSTRDKDEEYLVQYLLYGCAVLFMFSYIANTIALTHYLQIWNHALAPGVTRHWLQYWSWFLIMSCVVFGNVNISLELCNCLVIPTTDLFAMHLPRSEIVNSRINRCWTNLLPLDVPYLVSIAVYLAIVDTNIIVLHSVVIMNTLISSFASFSMTIFFTYLRRSYSSKNPIALYRFSFTFKSSLFESYFVHSHRRIKQAFAELISLRKNSLCIIDQCSEILSCMKVEGRILKDTKQQWDASKIRALQNVQKNSDKLENILAEQFGGHSNSVTVEHFQFVRMREINGQLVYDYDTGIKQCLECFACYNEDEDEDDDR